MCIFAVHPTPYGLQAVILDLAYAGMEAAEAATPVLLQSGSLSPQGSAHEKSSQVCVSWGREEEGNASPVRYPFESLRNPLTLISTPGPLSQPAYPHPPSSLSYGRSRSTSRPLHQYRFAVEFSVPSCRLSPPTFALWKSIPSTSYSSSQYSDVGHTAHHRPFQPSRSRLRLLMPSLLPPRFPCLRPPSKGSSARGVVGGGLAAGRVRGYCHHSESRRTGVSREGLRAGLTRGLRGGLSAMPCLCVGAVTEAVDFRKGTERMPTQPDMNQP